MKKWRKIMIKKVLLFLIVASPFSIVGMEQPYEPGFMARHPQLTRTVKTVGAGIVAGAATYAGNQLLKVTEKIGLRNVVLAGTATAAVTYLYEKYKKPNFLDSTLCNPQAITEYLDRYKNKLDQASNVIDKIENIDERMNTYKELVEKYQKEAQAPFLRLGECAAKSCPLTRSNNEAYRRIFENTTSEALLGKLKTTNDVVYTSFGSGGKLQDLKILTQVLAKKPDARVAVHLIDVRNQAYANYCNLLHGGQVKNEHAFSLESVRAQLLQQAKEQFEESLQEYLHEDDPSRLEFVDRTSREKTIASLREEGINEKEVQMMTFVEDLDHKAFLSWFTSNFPKATISLYTHGSAKGYLEAINKYRLPLPDVLVSADIQDDTGHAHHAFENYNMLCSYMHEKKASCTNILLAHEGDFLSQKGVIISFNKERVAEGDTSFTFKEKVTGQEKQLFVHRTKI
jgi:hypothetical protein